MIAKRILFACVVSLGICAPGASKAETPQSHPMISIAETDAADEGLITDRCESFRTAILVYRQILRSNPIYGRDTSRGAMFAWIADPGFSEPLKMAVVFRADHAVSYVQEYLDAFGGVTLPTVVPNMSLYQSDKATCVHHFRSEDVK